MSINSAVASLRLPADPAASERGADVITAIRRLARSFRWPQQRPHLNIGDSYRIPDGRLRCERGGIWVHTHH